MKRNEISRTVRAYGRIAMEYAPGYGPFDEDEPVVARLKRAVQGLTPDERRTIILYSELQSIRALGTALGVSHMTAQRRVRRIREKILKEINKQP